MDSGVVYTQPEVTPQSPPAPQPSGGLPRPLVVAGIGGLVVILLLVAAFSRIRTSTPTTPPVETTPTPSLVQAPIAPTTPMPVNKPGWKTYIDSTGVFSIDYPEEFTLKDNYLESTFRGITLDRDAQGQTASASANISLKVIYLMNSAKNAAQMASEQTLAENLPASTVQTTKLSGMDALEIPLKGEWGRGKIIFLEKDGAVYRLSSIIAAPLNTIAGSETLVNQIFSSFKILDPNTRGK